MRLHIKSEKRQILLQYIKYFNHGSEEA